MSLVGAFDQEKALVGAFSVIVNFRINFVSNWTENLKPANYFITKYNLSTDLN